MRLEAPKRQIDISALSAGARRPGDRARDRPHLHDGSRHPRARLLQPPAQGRAVHGSKAAGNSGLGSRTSAAERAKPSACARWRKRRRRPRPKRRSEAAEGAAAQKAEEEKGAADGAEPAKDGEDGQPAKAPFAPAPPKSDQVGANGPGSSAPTPPPRPKARPTPVEPSRAGSTDRTPNAVGEREAAQRPRPRARTRGWPMTDWRRRARRRPSPRDH